jgi:uncharacterized SAM-binding protein YcdF (DUF218 family)
MFFILSKTLYFFLMPLPLVSTLILVGTIIKHKIWKKRLIYTGIGLFLFFTNPYLSNVSIKSWEGNPTPIDVMSKHDIGVVLTGITNRYKRPSDRVYMQRGADRILHTIQLYKLGLIDKILISGGSGKLIDNSADVKEADELKKTLRLADIPEADIYIENTSRNTYENALHSSRILATDFPNQSIILITSAFHIRRASACFAKQKCQITPFGTDYISHDRAYNLDDFIVPKSGAIRNWEVIIKESLGMTMYWISGYI